MKFHFLYIIYFFVSFIPVYSTATEYRLGIQGKFGYHRILNFNNENNGKQGFQPMGVPAPGFYISASIHKRWFVDLGTLLSRAKFRVQFTRDNAEFIDADIRFTELDLRINGIINPDSRICRIYVFGGVQHLIRRWGEERYKQSIIEYTYWPDQRLYLQAGAGCLMNISHATALQLYAGLNYNERQKVVYDTPLQQIFFGLVLSKVIYKERKKNFNKCFNDF